MGQMIVNGHGCIISDICIYAGLQAPRGPRCVHQSQGQLCNSCWLFSYKSKSCTVIYLKRLDETFHLFQSTLPPPEKNAQLDDDGQLLLHDVVCLWNWMRPKLKSQFPGAVLQRHEELFMRGPLGEKKRWFHFPKSKFWPCNFPKYRRNLVETFGPRQSQLWSFHGFSQNPVTNWLNHLAGANRTSKNPWNLDYILETMKCDGILENHVNML